MLKYLYIIIAICLNIEVCAQNNILLKLKKYSNEDFKELIFISIKEQKLYYIKNDKIINSFVISSSKYGTGNKYTNQVRIKKKSFENKMALAGGNPNLIK